MEKTDVSKATGLSILLGTAHQCVRPPQLGRLWGMQAVTRTLHTVVGPENTWRAGARSLSLSLSASNEHKHLLDIFLHILTFSNCLPAPIHTFHNMAINCSPLLSSIDVHGHDCSLALFPV